jgi:hypothetical protein
MPFEPYGVSEPSALGQPFRVRQFLFLQFYDEPKGDELLNHKLGRLD